MRTPYRTLRNKSEKSPFLYAFCTVSEIKDSVKYYSSRDCKTIKKCYQSTIGACVKHLSSSSSSPIGRAEKS